jgi:hypothetical protein
MKADLTATPQEFKQRAMFNNMDVQPIIRHSTVDSSIRAAFSETKRSLR